MSVLLPDNRPLRRPFRQDPRVSALQLSVLSAFFVVVCKKYLGPEGGAAAVWFADAIAIAYLYRSPLRDWPLLVAAALFGNLAGGVATGLAVGVAAIYTLVALVGILLAAALLRYFCPKENHFDALRYWLRFICFSALVPPLIGAGIGAAVVAYRTGLPYSSLILPWYLADAIGILVLLPLALHCRLEGLRAALKPAPLARFLAVAAIAIGLVFFLLEVALLPFVFISLPLIWAAARLSVFQTLLLVFVTVTVLALRYVGIETHANPALTSGAPQSRDALLVLSIFVAAVPAYAMAVYANIERNRNARIVEVESSFRAAVENSRIGMLLVSLEGRILQANRSFCEFLQYTAEELEGRSIFDITYREDDESSRALWRDYIAGLRDAPRLEKRYLRRDGVVVWGHLSCCLARGVSGQPIYSVSQVEDIDRRKRSEADLMEAKERLQVTLSSIADAVITTDVGRRINFMNPVAEQMTGVTFAEARGQPIESVFRITRGWNGERLDNSVAECLQRRETVYGSSGAALQSRDGRIYDIKSSVSPLKTGHGELFGAVAVFQDVSESRQLIRQLSYRASHDDLTGLPNRDAFKRELMDAIDSVRGSEDCHAFAFVDLDRFKIVNDSAGHLAGDALLKKISKYLCGLLRSSDSVARLGGDEFGLLFRHCSREQAKLRCDQLIRQIVALRFAWDDRVYDVGASVGITEVNRYNDRLGDLLSQADVACYSAKHKSRGTVMIYDMERSAAADQHREIIMASAIREALDERRLTLCAQPIAATGNVARISHYEMLVRMVDDYGSLILPAAFIPAAERYGLMQQIDRWVADEVLVQRAAEIARAGLHFSLNISADALGDADFQAHLIRVLETTPIPLSRVGFEITETAMINQMENASHFVTALRKMGCSVALDDFGNGLSSFNYLKTFSIDFIKIDGSFVRQVESNFVDSIIVESIHQMARRLGARTIAEYVEDASIAARLHTIGVDLVQGYHIGRPEPLDQFLHADIENNISNKSDALLLG